MVRTTFEVQRDFALSAGLRTEIIWDSLLPDQADVLKQKIETLLPDENVKYTKGLEKQRNTFFENVWLQRQYTNRTLLSAIIYVLVTDERNPTLALQATNFSCHPLFRTRKCIRDDNSAGCCMIFVDEHGRIYANWAQFLLNNALPPGTMIAPAQGIYTFDDDTGEVKLEIHATAAAGVKSKILNASDTVANVGGLVATVPIAAALAVPVAAPLLLAATVVGVATAAYSTLRAGTRLFDRRRHGQSIALSNSEARGNWLGAAGGVVGLGATGATKALTTVAAAGQEVSTAARLAVNGINVSSVVLSGTGVANGIYHLYMANTANILNFLKSYCVIETIVSAVNQVPISEIHEKVNDEESLSGLDVLQLASSLMIFTHSINNLRIASKITNGSGSTLRRVLHNRTRKIFDKIARESRILHAGDGKFDIIRTLNDIPFKEALLNIQKINAQISNGVSAITAVGATLLPKLVNAGTNGGIELNLPMIAEQFGPKFVQHIASMGNFVDVTESLTKNFCEYSVQFLLELARRFIETSTERIERTLNTFISTEMVLYRMLLHCVKNYGDLSYDFLERNSVQIMNEVENYFQSLNPISNNVRKHKCAVCKGTFYICDL